MGGEKEPATLALSTFQPKLSTHQAHQLRTDSETQSRASEFACCRAVGLLERFKDDLVLFRRDTDAGIRNFKQKTCRLYRAGLDSNAHHDFAFAREFHRVSDQVDQDLP